MKIRNLLAAACGLSFLIASCSQTPAPVAPEPTAPIATALPSQPTISEETTPTAAPSSTPQPQPSTTQVGSEPDIIGYTVAGRPLTMYRYGNGPSGRLIVAGIHGGYEWNTIALAHQLMSHLSVYPETIPSKVSLYLLPALNPDGEARSSSYEGRANENGVDLNRNWPSLWQEVWPKAGCWNYRPIHGGTAPASEPEVAALMDFILANDIEAILSYHSAALGIFAGGQPHLGDSVSLADAVAEVAPYPYPPLNAGCLYTGQFTDWAAEAGIPAIDVELTNHRDTDLEINLRVLEAFLHWEPEGEPN